MRIIGGRLKGKTILPPQGYKARPTTDFAKEGLFNVLNNEYEMEGLQVLDLFGGTGLARHSSGFQGSLGTGAAGDNITQAVIHIVHCLVAENLFRILGIIQHHIAVAVIHFGIQPCFPVNALVGNGGKACCHCPEKGKNHLRGVP